MVKNSTACNSNQRWSNETCQCKCENCQRFKEDSQLTNIAPQDVQGAPPPPLPSYVPRVTSKEPIWPFRGRPNLTSWACPEMTSRGCTTLTSKGPPCDAGSGCPQDVLRTSSRGPSKHILWTIWCHLLDHLKFIFTFLWEPNLSDSN